MALTALFPATQWSLVQRLDATISGGGVLVERYAGAIRAYLGIKFPADSRQLVDDICQEVLMELLERPEVLAKASKDTKRRFRYFLMGVAFNCARNARRRLLKGKECSVEALDLEQDVSADASAMDAAWAAGVVEMALEDVAGWEASGLLEAPALALLKEQLFAGATVRDLASRFELSRATCQRRLAAARNLLVKAIMDHLQSAGEIDHDATMEEAHKTLLTALDCGA